MLLPCEQMEQDAENKKLYQDVLSKPDSNLDGEEVKSAVEEGFEKGVKNSKIANSKVEQNMFVRDGNAWRSNGETQDLKGRTDLYDEWYAYFSQRRGVSKAKGGITDNEYLDKLTEITDMYLVEGTDEWWKAQQEITRLEQSLEISKKTSEKASTQTVDEAKERLNKYR